MFLHVALRLLNICLFICLPSKQRHDAATIMSEVFGFISDNSERAKRCTIFQSAATSGKKKASSDFMNYFHWAYAVSCDEPGKMMCSVQ